MIIYGTRTLGKEDHKKRYKKCENCGKFNKLESYSARKWFTLYFIPLIPLAKKRIVDQCPSCSLGYHHEFKKWEAAKTANLQKLSAGEFDFQDPQQAVNIHQIAELYASDSQSAAIADKLNEQYKNDNAMQHYLSKWQFSVGKFDQAVPTMEHLSREGYDDLNLDIARYYSSKNDMETATRYLLKVPNHNDDMDMNLYEKAVEFYKNQGETAKAYAIYGYLSKFPIMRKLLSKRKYKKDIQRMEDTIGISERISL